MRLFHFSEEPSIDRFIPRPVRVSADRPTGQAWLNGPLVWAIDEAHEPLYLFPRECPRILVWPTVATLDADREAWFGGSRSRVIAHIERAWLDRVSTTTVYRYDLPTLPFEDIEDAGMWVSRTAVTPIGRESLTDLPAELEKRDVELRVMESLTPLAAVWKTSLHASGLRLRNARGWAGRASDVGGASRRQGAVGSRAHGRAASA